MTDVAWAGSSHSRTNSTRRWSMMQFAITASLISSTYTRHYTCQMPSLKSSLDVARNNDFPAAGVNLESLWSSDSNGVQSRLLQKNAHNVMCHANRVINKEGQSLPMVVCLEISTQHLPYNKSRKLAKFKVWYKVLCFWKQILLSYVDGRLCTKNWHNPSSISTENQTHRCKTHNIYHASVVSHGL